MVEDASIKALVDAVTVLDPSVRVAVQVPMPSMTEVVYALISIEAPSWLFPAYDISTLTFVVAFESFGALCFASWLVSTSCSVGGA
ncbi:hypothetical protein D9M68_999480 [compost metagenome]